MQIFRIMAKEVKYHRLKSSKKHFEKLYRKHAVEIEKIYATLPPFDKMRTLIELNKQVNDGNK